MPLAPDPAAPGNRGIASHVSDANDPGLQCRSSASAPGLAHSGTSALNNLGNVPQEGTAQTLYTEATKRGKTSLLPNLSQVSVRLQLIPMCIPNCNPRAGKERSSSCSAPAPFAVLLLGISGHSAPTFGVLAGAQGCPWRGHLRIRPEHPRAAPQMEPGTERLQEQLPGAPAPARPCRAGGAPLSPLLCH